MPSRLNTSSFIETSSGGALSLLTQVGQAQQLDILLLRLQDLRSWLQQDLIGLEQAIEHVIPGNSPLAGSRVGVAADHLLSLAGKRIRPLCVLVAARFGTVTSPQTLLDLAVACELVHAATLLHDDVIDDAQVRRGKQAARVLYGNSASILAGDHLLVQALRLVLRHQHHDLLDQLLLVIESMVAAEALQLERRGRFEPDRALYLDVIRGKTAALFGWGLSAGGTVAHLDNTAVQALHRLGMGLGLAFQLIDDVLDWEGTVQTTGKDAFTDIREGKLTWPAIVAAESSDRVRLELSLWAKSPEQDMPLSQAEALRQAVQATGALQATRAFAQQKAAEACAELQYLPACEARTALQLLVESAVHRSR